MRLAFVSRIRVALMLGLVILSALARRASATQPYTPVLQYQLSSPGGTTFLPSLGPKSAALGQIIGQETTNVASSSNHAVVWLYPSGTLSDLHPGGSFSISFANATNGAQQVGSARNDIANSSRAFLWSGTSGSAVNLHPTLLGGFASSEALGISPSGNQQVGDGFTNNANNETHALLWTGTAASAVDLHPTNLGAGTVYYSQANDTNGTKQVGYANGDPTSFFDHAIMWSGAANTAVDLNPTNLTGYDNSYAYSLSSSGNHQVGYGNGSATSGNDHALLWSGTSGTAVDLNPTNLTNFTRSYANGCDDTVQVGYGFHTTDSANHALAWVGTASTAIDLQSLLPTINGGSWQESAAFTIDANGNIYGWAHGTPDGNLPGGYYAVEWTVPEPTGALIPLLACALFSRRKRHQRCTRRV